MTSAALVHPKRPKVTRAPSQRAAARTVRRSAPLTTSRVWRRSALPGPVIASAGVPLAEAVMIGTLVALLFLPVALFTGWATGTLIVAGTSVAVAGYLMWARRVVVGEHYVAVRRLGRFHAATVDHVRHLELKHTQRGGLLCLHTDDGRCMRLRRVEVTDPGVAAALRAMSARHEGTRDPFVEQLLDLPRDERRLRATYRAEAA